MNRAPLTGMAATAVTFVGGMALFHDALPALLISLGAGAGIGLIMQGVFPYRGDLEGYRLDALARVRKLLKMLDSIERSAKNVTDDASRRSLGRGCGLVRDVIKSTQEKEPRSVASAAAGLTAYVLSVQNVVSTYLTLQDDADIPGARAMMTQAHGGFADFENWAKDRKAQAQRGDILRMKADLESMKPLPQLTVTEEG